MDHWPALKRWRDPAYLLAAAGPRTVPVELGEHYLAPGWGQALMPFSEFVAAHLLGGACPGSSAADGPDGAVAERGGRARTPAGTVSAAAGGLHAGSERARGAAGTAAAAVRLGAGPGDGDNGGAGAAAGSEVGAAAAHCGGAGAAAGPGGAAQRGYLAQHDLFAQVRATLPYTLVAHVQPCSAQLSQGCLGLVARLACWEVGHAPAGCKVVGCFSSTMSVSGVSGVLAKTSLMGARAGGLFKHRLRHLVPDIIRGLCHCLLQACR